VPDRTDRILVLREAWQREIVAPLQKKGYFRGESLRHIGVKDIDWPSWDGFLLAGQIAAAGSSGRSNRTYGF
jgi:hypothetical protein